MMGTRDKGITTPRVRPAQEIRHDSNRRRRPRPGGPILPLSAGPAPARIDLARDRRPRSEDPREATALWGQGVRGYAGLDEALADPAVELVVIATPHDSHADLAVRTLEASRHCVVDKVMALTTRDADRMIAARNRSGCMLSVFHNRRWDWDFATVKEVLDRGWIGRPLWFESAVCRSAAPRGWRGSAAAAGTILHDWGAHLVDQALQFGLGPCRRLAAWLSPSPWEGVDSGGHGRLILEFDDVLFQIETSRVCRIDRPRWWIVGSDGGFVKYGVDPQEEAFAPTTSTSPRSRPSTRASSVEPATRGDRREPGRDGPRPLGWILSQYRGPSRRTAHRWRSPPNRPARSFACSRQPRDRPATTS